MIIVFTHLLNTHNVLGTEQKAMEIPFFPAGVWCGITSFVLYPGLGYP